MVEICKKNLEFKLRTKSNSFNFILTYHIRVMLVKAKHRHHVITVPIGIIVGAFGMVEILSANAAELTEIAEITQACLDLIVFGNYVIHYFIP